MVQKESTDVFDVLQEMKTHELWMAEFYRAFSEVWPAEREFWFDMERAEKRHAQYLEKIVQCLTEKPDHFHLGRPIRLAAIRTSISGIQSVIDQFKKRKIPIYKAIFIARDMEQSVIESRVGEFLKTEDIECGALMEEMIYDTKSHLERLTKKIGEWTK